MSATRIATGTSGLDKLLGGGLLPGGVYSIIGPPGSGKTILGIQFLIEGVKRGENAFLVSLDEPPCEVKENLHMMFGGNFDKIFVLDGTLEMKHYEITPLRDVTIVRRSEPFGSVFPEIPNSIDVRNPDLTVSSIQEMIKVEVREKKISRLVIDSMTAVKLFLMTTSERNQFTQSFLRFLSDLGIATLVMIQENDSSSDSETSKMEHSRPASPMVSTEWIQAGNLCGKVPRFGARRIDQPDRDNADRAPGAGTRQVGRRVI